MEQIIESSSSSLLKIFSLQLPLCAMELCVNQFLLLSILTLAGTSWSNQLTSCLLLSQQILGQFPIKITNYPINQPWLLQMWRKIQSLYRHVGEDFHHLHPLALPRDLVGTFRSKIYFTPKLQRIRFTEELHKFIRFLCRKDKIGLADMRAFTEAVLVEYGAVHGLEGSPLFKGNLNFTISRDYEFKANQLSPFHGRADYMLWLNDRHFVPVLFLEELNPTAGLGLAHMTMALKCLSRKDYRNSGYSIITTGQQWQMFKVLSSERAEKSVIYQGRNRFKNILEDVEMIQAVLGVIDECLETGREDVQVLKLAYGIIDDKKYMIQGTSKQEAERASPVGRLLRRYFQKKEDETSK